MPIDIELLRAEKDEGDPQLVFDSEKKRGRNTLHVEEAIKKDGLWRKCQFDLERGKEKLNSLRILYHKNKDTDNSNKENALSEMKELKKFISENEIKANQLRVELDSVLNTIGNILNPNVPTSNDEADNLLLREWNDPHKKKFENKNFEPLPHYNIMTKLDILNLKKGTEVFGHRGYYLKGLGVQLNYALIMYGLSFLRKHGYTEIQPPYMLKRAVMSEAAELADFSETLYKISAETTGKDSNEDLFLIATSEQPICALHRNEILQVSKLPLKYAGISTCFRKEAGAHGKDMTGIFRTHQFEKVEQFRFVLPENSTNEHQEMIKLAEEFYKSLNISYRIVSIASGELNNAASIKFDLEAWFPSTNTYRELVSCSNCLDYQSRALSIRLNRAAKIDSSKKQYVHMLNGTLVATERALCCMLENWQTENGIDIPSALTPYLDGLTFIPYTE